jgi:hypothetical protein
MRILLIVLGLLAAALYAKILLPPGENNAGPDGSGVMASVDAGEGATNPQTLRPAPEAQISIIKDVFAPELTKSEEAGDRAKD